MKELSFLLFLSLIISFFAKNPEINGHYYPPNGNNNYDYDHRSNSYNDPYNEHNGFSENVYCLGNLLFGAFLFSIWIAVLILYFIVNRKKNTFTVLINSQPNNISGYMNV